MSRWGGGGRQFPSVQVYASTVFALVPNADEGAPKGAPSNRSASDPAVLMKETIPNAEANQASHERIAVFIDGFNVYWGLRDKEFKRFYWLDYQALSRSFVRQEKGEDLVAIKYFTTLVTKPADSRERQTSFLRALAAHTNVEIIKGKYRSRPVKCKSCGERWDAPEEKMTDVAIATHMVTGALQDQFDTALLICADADLIPAVQAVRSCGKKVLIVSPRGRTSDDLAASGDAHLHISTTVLGRCQLPDTVFAGHRMITRPGEWR